MFLHEERHFSDFPLLLTPQTKSCASSPSGWAGAALRRPGRDETQAEPRAPQIEVSLQDQELWAKFSSRGTEMIITKSGRRMFPPCKVSVTGLNPKAKYLLMMDMVPFDNNKYKWNRDRWEPSGLADPHLPNRFFIHPESPALGEKWMQYPISFHKLKLTNNTLNSSGLVVLHSMHKYLPRLHVVQAADVCSQRWGAYLHFAFPDAAFIAVTAYQNAEITKLKIDNNPFAKGFRDYGLNSKRQRDQRVQSSCKRPPENPGEQSGSVNESKTGDTDDADFAVSSTEEPHTAERRAGSPDSNPFISAFMRRHERGACGVEEWTEGHRGPLLNSQDALDTTCGLSSCHYPASAALQPPGPVPPSSDQRFPQGWGDSRAPGAQPSTSGGPPGGLPLPLPPRVSRVRLPESLETAGPLTSDPSGPRPLADILNRIRDKPEAAQGSPGVWHGPGRGRGYSFHPGGSSAGYLSSLTTGASVGNSLLDVRANPGNAPSLECPYRAPVMDFYSNLYGVK
nr:PREDICTED: T-box transcription factor TBX6L-like [Lepisosteus oculatus]XP_015223037.1 PREDICTED: T-box transcription factor TBX6L-like [Lepisosteus oculatus]XP_015223038.1 PREDICTED: T-box transcription factor TBX6L-like [Lepisosteus oculatus]